MPNTQKAAEKAEAKREEAAEIRAEARAEAKTKAHEVKPIFLVIRTPIEPGGSQEKVRRNIVGAFPTQEAADILAQECLSAAANEDQNFSVFSLPIGVPVADATVVSFHTRR